MARKPDIGILLGIGKPKAEGESEAEGSELGQAVLDAIEAKDPVALEAALEDCYRSFDAEPHEEGEHLGEETEEAME